MEKTENNLKYEVDPDYASHNNALKRVEKEREENKDIVENLKQALVDEFNKDLTVRKNQIEQIQKNIHKTQKLLHLLRYVLITSYYDSKELEYNGADVKTEYDPFSYAGQNRLHPALKKLLGENAKTVSFATGKRKCTIGTNSSTSLPNNESNSNKSVTKNIPINTPVTRAPNNTGTSAEIDKNRQKIRKRIIVGNVSKWMPSIEDDNLTHKWMVYVRGPKDNPDISHFVEKVIFYLHPSYKPYDVVEVSVAPFHLTRRGWGEFPLRIQIFFKCSMNKPVDVIHNLKLDKTHVDRQTLGNESIIDLYLYDNEESSINIMPLKEEFTVKEVKEELDLEMFENSFSYNIKCEDEIGDFSKDVIMSPSSVFEHDYCFGEESDSKQTLIEHSYCSDPSEESKDKPKPLNVQNLQQQNNPLIYGLDESYSIPDMDLYKRGPLFYRKITMTHSKPILKMVPSIKSGISQKIHPVPVMNDFKQNITPDVNDRLYPSELNLDEYKINLPKSFKNMGEVLLFLFRRMPLWTELANVVNYRCLYPFTARSLEEFKSWNIGRQINAEWYRARMIKKLIQDNNIFGHERWNTKSIFIYGKTHGFTASPKTSLLKSKTFEKEIIKTCYNLSKTLPIRDQHNTSNEEILVDIESHNVLDSSDSKRIKLSLIDELDQETNLQCSFVREEALKSGIILRNEDIAKDVVFNAAERTILEAVKCLANQLVRRGLFHHTAGSVDGQIKTEINPRNILEAIQEREEISSFMTDNPL